ncbi:ATP-binding protein [Spiractinospora alimapuensis]|uniref:ATP-binding protein n=1 Tax=Spiractinospora alimapuensis TaxID=2820884 RepID=UPI001F35E5B9|nr:ATP-binding protein [Spiractinospora alimapuensis]
MANDDHRNDNSGNAETSIQGRDFKGPVTINNNAASQAPSFVPPTTPDFVNRVSELATIEHLCGRSRGTTSIVLNGVQGIGKSALMREAADRYAPSFPGGRLYLEYPASAGAEDWDDAVIQILRSLGTSDHYLPATREGRLGLFRDRLKERATLILVEGARYPAQLATLAPTGPGSVIVASSAGPSLAELEIGGARMIHLDALDDDASWALLSGLSDGALTDSDRRAAEPLLEYCGGLPLALTLVAARIRRDGRGALPRLAAEWADEGRRIAELGGTDAGISGVFDRIYQPLPEHAARLYRRLGEWPGPRVDARLARALDGDIDADHTSGALGELCDAGLLVREQSDTFRFGHDLLRLHARALADQTDGATERGAVLVRGIDHYLCRLGFAEKAARGVRLRVTDVDALVAGATDPFAGNRVAAQEWLERERHTIRSLVLCAAAKGFHTQAWRLAELATALYLDTRFVEDWAATGMAGADAARAAGDAAAEVRLRSFTSRPLTNLGRLEQAGGELRRAMALVNDTTLDLPLLVRASAHELHGRYLHAVRRWGDALDALDRSEALHNDVAAAGDPHNGRRGAALAAFYRGGVAHAMGDFERVFVELDQASAGFRALDPPDARMDARVLVARGEAHHAQERYAEARRDLNDAVVVLRSLGQDYYEAQARECLARSLVAEDLTADAVEHLDRAIFILREGGSPRARELEWFRADLAPI